MRSGSVGAVGGAHPAAMAVAATLLAALVAASLLLASLLVASLLVAAPASAAELGEPFTLDIGASTTVGPQGLAIGFAVVHDDLRCPINMFCFWEGDALCAFWAQLPGQPVATFELHTSWSRPMSTVFAGYLIRLQRLDPPRVYPDEIDPESYVATLLVTQIGVPVEARTWGTVKGMYD